MPAKQFLQKRAGRAKPRPAVPNPAMAGPDTLLKELPAAGVRTSVPARPQLRRRRFFWENHDDKEPADFRRSPRPRDCVLGSFRPVGRSLRVRGPLPPYQRRGVEPFRRLVCGTAPVMALIRRFPCHFPAWTRPTGQSKQRLLWAAIRGNGGELGHQDSGTNKSDQRVRLHVNRSNRGVKRSSL